MAIPEKLPKVLETAVQRIVENCKKVALEEIDLQRKNGRWQVRSRNSPGNKPHLLSDTLLWSGTAAQVAKILNIWAAGYCKGRAGTGGLNAASKDKKLTTAKIWAKLNGSEQSALMVGTATITKEAWANAILRTYDPSAPFSVGASRKLLAYAAKQPSQQSKTGRSGLLF